MRGSCHTVFHRRGCHACRQMNCLAVPAGTRNVFEKVVSLVALWMLGYSKAETAQPGMKSVQPASGSKQSHAPAEAAPGVQSTCQQACWQSVWHQAAVLEHNTGVSAHISCCLTRDQMTRALLQSGLPLCWHTLHCSDQGDKDVPMPAERPAATASGGLGKGSRLACVSSSQMGQERCGNCLSMHFGIL